MRMGFPRGLVIVAALAAAAGGWALASWVVRPGADRQLERAAEQTALDVGAGAARGPSEPTLPPPRTSRAC